MRFGVWGARFARSGGIQFAQRVHQARFVCVRFCACVSSSALVRTLYEYHCKQRCIVKKKRAGVTTADSVRVSKI